ncbi:MAG: adenylyltransferase/cytidyltransferase family protein [Nanoarchaeota archaeon]|nr:adenylyltransferase/cytidyltransferase family protein [Nanoarchaeota archaeon]
MESNKKIKTKEEIKEIMEYAERQGKKVVFTNGGFDLLHVGYVKYLQKAKELGGILIVALNSDSSIKAYKDEKRPIIPEKERAEVLSALECVDYTFIFYNPTIENILKELKPKIYCKGGDYVIDPKDATEEKPAINQNERKIIESYGGKINIININSDASASKIIKKIVNLFKEQ